VNKVLFLVSPRIRRSLIGKTNKRKPHGKVIAAYYKVCMGHINTFHGRKPNFLNFKPEDICSYVFVQEIEYSVT
jgi:hypothetical protein